MSANPQLFDNTDTLEISSQLFANVSAGSVSPDVELHLWNGKDSGTADTMKNIRITTSTANDKYTGDNNANGQELVTGHWVEIKSAGVIGTGITDDAMTSYKPVGGDPIASINNYLGVGDIPTNCARKLFIHINTPVGAQSSGTIAFTLKVLYTL